MLKSPAPLRLASAFPRDRLCRVPKYVGSGHPHVSRCGDVLCVFMPHSLSKYKKSIDINAITQIKGENVSQLYFCVRSDFIFFSSRIGVAVAVIFFCFFFFQAFLLLAEQRKAVFFHLQKAV